MLAIDYIKKKKLDYLQNKIDLNDYAKSLRMVWLSDSEIQELKAIE